MPLKTYFILIEGLNPGQEDLYAAKANGYHAYEDSKDSDRFWIERGYNTAVEARAELEDRYGTIIRIEIE